MSMPEIVRCDSGESLPGAVLERVAKVLKGGGVIVYATNTLYGLGASIRSEQGIASIFRIKGRPEGVPLSVMATRDQIIELCAIPDIARPFLESGDIRVTAVLPALEAAPQKAVHNGTLAVRFPCDPLTRSLVERAGPVTSTSANRHGTPTPHDMEGIVEDLGGLADLYLDSGSRTGTPTTLIDYTGENPKIIRDGALSRKEVEKFHER